MKKNVLISVLCLLLIAGMTVANRSCWSTKEKENKVASPEIKAGQVWRCTFSGTEYEILEAGDYISYCYAYGTYKSPDVKSKREFYEEFKFTQAINLTITFPEETSDAIIFSSPTKHKVRFQGHISIGGEVELEWDKLTLWAESTAFDNWLQDLTIKEIREKWGFDVVKYKILE